MASRCTWFLGSVVILSACGGSPSAPSAAASDGIAIYADPRFSGDSRVLLTTPKKGDHLRATLINGNIANFTVADVQPDALVGTDGQRVLYRDIARLEHKHLSKGRTGALVAGLAVAGFAVLVVVALASDPFIYY